MFDYVKFGYMALCFGLALASGRFCFSKRDWAFLMAGMAFTLLSDFFLVLLNHDFGVVTFCFAHVAYILRAQYKYRRIVAGTFLLSLPLFWFLDWRIAAGALYMALFIQDIGVNIMCYKRREASRPRINQVLIISGLLLFALCDLQVLLYNLPRFMAFPAAVAETAFKLIWVFYAPSQFLLAVSAILPRKLKIAHES